MEMTCPKCQAPMRSYERNSVHVDQCTQCRGIFLDRGELERLVDAESSWHGSGQPQQPQQPPAGGGQASSLGAIVGEVMQQAKAHKQGDQGSRQGYAAPRRKKKDSFLGELFG